MARTLSLLCPLLLLLATSASATIFPGRDGRLPCGRTTCPVNTVCVLSTGRCTRARIVTACSVLCRNRGRRAACLFAGSFSTCSAWRRLQRQRSLCRVVPNKRRVCAPGRTCVLDRVWRGGWGRGTCRRVSSAPLCGARWCAVRGGRSVCRAGGRYVTCGAFTRILRRPLVERTRNGVCFGAPTGRTTRCPPLADCVLTSVRADGWARGQCQIVVQRGARCSRRRCGALGLRTPCVDGGRFWDCRGWNQARRLLTLSLGASAPTSPTAAAGACSTSRGQVVGAPPPGPACPSGQLCVISDFGLPAADRPNRGRCVVGAQPARCTVDLCGSRGGSALCATPDRGDATTCRAWAARSDGGVRPDCGIPCARNCAIRSPRAPVDNNGKRYCNACVLRVASCRVGFAIFGPVAPAVRPPTPTLALPTAPAGACSTSPGQFVGASPPGPACPSGQLCVISDFGLPAADRPNRGRCVVGAQPARCTVDLCGSRGGSALCATPDRGDATTCRAWAARSDGGVRPDCLIICTKDCALGTPQAPVDNNGKRYCNACELRSVACTVGFAIFGPVAPAVRPPTSTTRAPVASPRRVLGTCTFELCAMNGARKACALPDTKRASTCGGWATRTDGGTKPDCGIICLQDCPGVKDNKGNTFCNGCILGTQSCLANFEFYGPIPN